MKSGWGSLPWHVLDDILNKVKTQQDYLEFDLVCASWHRVAMADKQRSRVNALPRVPMLLVPSKENHSHSLYNVVTKRFSKSKLVVPYEGHFAGFSRGWLVAVEKDLSVTLYKASPNKDDITAPTTIRLPIIDPDDNVLVYFDYKVKRVVISADPLTNPNECIVVIIFGSWLETAFVRPNKDTHWTRAVTPCFADILYCNDQFYAVTGFGMLFSFRVANDPVIYLHDMKQVVPSGDPFRGKSYLAESQGELLLVRRSLNWRQKLKRESTTHRTYTRKTLDVYVYKLDVEKGEWAEIKNLSDAALFLGDNSSISISCLDFARCKPDCIYFTHDADGLLSTRFRADDFGEYDLGYGMTRHFGMDKATAINIFPRIPIWFVPNAQ